MEIFSLPKTYSKIKIQKLEHEENVCESGTSVDVTHIDQQVHCLSGR